MIRVREVTDKKGRESSESRIHRLTHVSNYHFVALRHWRRCRLHQHVLQRLLHCRGSLVPRGGDQACDRCVLQHRLLQIRLESLEVFVLGLREHLNVLFFFFFFFFLFFFFF